MATAKRILGCSTTTSITVSRAELGIYPLEINGDAKKLRWQYKVRNMPEKRLPATADRAICEKITRGRAGIRWDSVVEKIWKNSGGDQDEVRSNEKFGGYKTEVKARIDERERLALRNKVKEEKKFKIHGELREDIG